ncbi:MAG: hypothetical protein GXZ01_02520 [Clostridiaceae bacterium]|nr:hypothetical protein [Clostridiaceae bacterium]
MERFAFDIKILTSKYQDIAVDIYTLIMPDEEKKAIELPEGNIESLETAPSEHTNPRLRKVTQ